MPAYFVLWVSWKSNDTQTKPFPSLGLVPEDRNGFHVVGRKKDDAFSMAEFRHIGDYW
jgi:hypothetical protein